MTETMESYGFRKVTNGFKGLEYRYRIYVADTNWLEHWACWLGLYFVIPMNLDLVLCLLALAALQEIHGI